jgi:hypothetical protein
MIWRWRHRTADCAPPVPQSVGTDYKGSFELWADKLVGSMRRLNRPIPYEAWVGAWLRQQPIGLGQVEIAKDKRSGRFSLALTVSVAPTDLICEDLVVYVWDGEGCSGRIRLDGTAQLDLVRQHLSGPMSIVLDLNFSKDGNARPFLGKGWSNAEARGSWALGDDSFIYFDRPDRSGTYKLRLVAHPFVLNRVATRQRLDLFVNETLVNRCVVSGEATMGYDCEFSGEVFSHGPRATIRLYHPDAVRISDIAGRPDKRRLALYVNRLSLVNSIQ